MPCTGPERLLPGFPWLARLHMSKRQEAPSKAYPGWLSHLGGGGAHSPFRTLSLPSSPGRPPLLSVSTQYLLSMVVEYFGRVGLPGHLYNRIHFFLAL